MTTASAHRAASGNGRLRSIGEVLAMLREEFGDLSSSKLRFLESEGLVAPTRLPNGYRKYTEPDIERIRVVLTLQRDRYLPLKVIREQLDRYDQGHDVLAAAPPEAVDVRDDRVDLTEQPEPAPADFRRRLARLAEETFAAPGEGTTYGREDLLVRSGLSRDALAEIEGARLIAPAPSGRYDEDALTVATIVARLTERGIEPRHIKPTRHSVDRELGQVEVLLAAQRRRRLAGQSDTATLVDSQREIAAGFLALHAALLRIGLRNL
jgi:DNA-binding transcriptional MerR regulator